MVTLIQLFHGDPNENTIANFDPELLGGVMVLAHLGASRGKQQYSDRHSALFLCSHCGKAE